MKMPTTLVEEKKRLSVKIRESVADDLALYCDVFAEATGHRVSKDTTLEHMIEDFMARDKDFQKRKKKRERTPHTGAPAAGIDSTAHAQDKPAEDSKAGNSLPGTAERTSQAQSSDESKVPDKSTGNNKGDKEKGSRGRFFG